MYSEFDFVNSYFVFYLQFQGKNLTRKLTDWNHQRVESLKNVVSLKLLNPLHLFVARFLSFPYPIKYVLVSLLRF